MSISELDFKFQGSKLEDVVKDVISRDNALLGRYKKGGGFGLDFYSTDYIIENYRWIKERADIADGKIKEAQLDGEDVDDPEVLKNLAMEVDKNIKKGKKDGSFINYICYLVVPIIIFTILFFLLT